MTPKTAINWLEQAKGNAEALELAKEALGKQIPRQPDWMNLYYCPTCAAIIGANYGTDRFCRSCGQALSWDFAEAENGELNI